MHCAQCEFLALKRSKNHQLNAIGEFGYERNRMNEKKVAF